jgi:WD40 repeat protein
MMILQSTLRDATGLMFTPNGEGLLAVSQSNIQLWPRWPDNTPKKQRSVKTSLERYAFTPDNKTLYLYCSGNSRTKSLSLARVNSREQATRIPSGGPAWLHFDSSGGYVIASHDHGRLTRFDYAPKLKNKFRKKWSIHRKHEPHRAYGTHYRFGAISNAAQIFVGIEYRFGSEEPFRGLATRSVATGEILALSELTLPQYDELLRNAGLKITIHPNGRFFAYPEKDGVRLWSLYAEDKLPHALLKADKRRKKPKAEKAKPKGKKKAKAPPQLTPEVHAVAFNNSGTLLAVVGNEGVVRMYDTRTWKLSHTYDWNIGPLRAVCFSPTGTHGAAISDTGQIVVWDID